MKIKVIGRRYAETLSHYSWDVNKRWACFAQEEERVWEIEAESVKAGERWLAENHPDMYMGANVIGENGDFKMLAVPCEVYGRGNYETLEARVAYVKKHYIA